MITKIISGGQTGVDRAALDVALKLNISHGGYCPKGRKAEDGTIDPKYNLTELASDDYVARTKKNVDASDGTVILYTHPLNGGTLQTYRYCKDVNKPVLKIDVETTPDQERIFHNWIDIFNIKTLNVAGPRASKLSEIYQISYESLLDWLQAIEG